MAAWTARIDTIVDAGDFEHAVVGVTYFDALDTGFVTPLWTHTFSFEFGVSNPDAASAIRKVGQQQRTVLAALAALQPLISTTIPVP